MGFAAENGTWRSAFLAGATELRHGNFGTPTATSSADLLGSLSVPQAFDSVAIRIDGPRAWNERIVISWVITDAATTYAMELRNGALNHRVIGSPIPDSPIFTLSRLNLIRLLGGTLDVAAAIASGAVSVNGDATVLQRLVSLLAPVDPDFAIITS
jgi:alkyl sulfatase BDS1-like metallo-beta-lactamase superfamily hydrolase